MKNTLEALLRARLADSRAMVGSLDINHDRVLLHFGAIGDLPRVTLSINDNEIAIALPDVLAVEWRLSDEAKRSGGSELVDPEKHSRDALIAMAKADGVELGKDDTKRVIATKINEKRAAA
jgi:hypothetical protein